jgi:hypothetical protein
MDADADRLADYYRHLATNEFDGYCDLYARIARGAAADRELLDLAATLAPPRRNLAVLLFAAVHDLVLAEPGGELAEVYRTGRGDPWPPFRTLVTGRSAELAATMATRSIQTNEVGRAVPVAAALTAAHRAAGRSRAVVEVGCSAGLNLLADRFAHTLGGGPALGDPASPVRLATAARGPLAPPWGPALPPLERRVGIDVAPLDVADPADRRWLQACLWPLVPDRPERLRAALALAAVEPPDLRRGDALDLLVPVVEELAAGGTAVAVVSTWAIAYLDADGRHRFGELLDGLAGGGVDLVAVTAEYPGIAPWVPAPARPPTGASAAGATVLGLTRWPGGVRDARAVAWMHAHGAWIDWLDGTTAGP